MNAWFDPGDPVRFTVALLASLVATWMVVVPLVALLGGWSRLAESYRFDGTFPGELTRMQSASLRWYTNYNNVLTIGIGPQGLYLRMPWPFRPGHPPLLIPWGDLRRGPGESLLRGIELRCARAPEIPVYLRSRLVARIEEYVGSPLPGTV